MGKKAISQAELVEMYTIFTGQPLEFTKKSLQVPREPIYYKVLKFWTIWKWRSIFMLEFEEYKVKLNNLKPELEELSGIIL